MDSTSVLCLCKFLLIQILQGILFTPGTWAVSHIWFDEQSSQISPTFELFWEFFLSPFSLISLFLPQYLKVFLHVCQLNNLWNFIVVTKVCTPWKSRWIAIILYVYAWHRNWFFKSFDILVPVLFWHLKLQ